MAGVEWVKVYTDTFDNRKIRTLRALHGDSGVLLWFRFLLLAGQVNDDGRIYLIDGERLEDRDVSLMLGEPLEVVEAVRPTLERLGLVDRDESGALVIAKWCERQNVDKLTEIRRMSAERSRNYRQRKAQETKELEELRHAPSRDVT